MAFELRALRAAIEKLYDQNISDIKQKAFTAVFAPFIHGLNEGTIRAAEELDGQWRTNNWVKKGILLGFRLGRIEKVAVSTNYIFYDKHTYPLKSIIETKGIRIVPGGSSIRDGCYIGERVTCMPPMYINTGAYVDDDTMVDSHALVGSCAQIGKRVHLSAASQIGGVLEPVGSLPVIVEDDVIVGGNCGVYEGTIVRTGAVLGGGTILTASTPVYDTVKSVVYKKADGHPLEIPAGAVVVPGTRPLGRGPFDGLSIYTPVIIKYRDDKTEGSVTLEDALR